MTSPTGHVSAISVRDASGGGIARTPVREAYNSHRYISSGSGGYGGGSYGSYASGGGGGYSSGGYAGGGYDSREPPRSRSRSRSPRHR